MRGWLRRGAYAAQLAGDRTDLWPAGALASLAFLGWPTLLLVVAPPDTDDLSFIGVSLVTSSAFPLNLVALAVAVAGGIALLCLVSAAAEAALLRAAASDVSGHPPLGTATLRAFAVTIIAILPASGAAAALAVGLASVAPDVYISPDVGTPLLLRLAAEVWPLLLVVGAAALVGQALGGTALRGALAPAAPPLATVLLAAARAVWRHPAPRLGVAAAGLLVDLVTAVVTYALLRVLWAPIAAGLAGGQLVSPETLLLLVGFVAIWLGLLLAAGALHVTISAWWALELARGDTAARRALGRPQPEG